MTTLDALPAGIKATIAQVAGRSAALIKARALGLRAGRSVEILARNGRLILAQVGRSRIALTRDLARHVEVHPL